MKNLILLAALSALCLPVSGMPAVGFPEKVAGVDNDIYSDRRERLDSTVVSASRAGAHTPVAFTQLGREELAASSPIGSLPMVLGLQPSVISMNEGGTGIGYSKLSVRGSKGSQINVTLNGITLNDAESQEMFWVNLPSMHNLVSSVQLQRGLGTSASGAGAFGASVNMSTASVGSEPHAGVELAAGSWGTFTSTVSAVTGLMRGGLYLDAAYSRNFTDGYIDNAFARVQSAYAALGWLSGSNSLRLVYLMGDQHTGITWNGVSRADMEAFGRTYNSAGLYYDSEGNRHRYSNETDNYTQHHLQLNYTREFARGLLWTTTFNWTGSYGHLDDYACSRSFASVGLDDGRLAALRGDRSAAGAVPSGSSVPFRTAGAVPDSGEALSDFIILEAMANNYFVINSQAAWKGSELNVVGGLNLSQYNGNHYGVVKWSSVLGDDFDYSRLDYSISPSNDWYYGRTVKREAGAFARAEYSPLAWLTAYADLQYRGVFLDMGGTDHDRAASLDYRKAWHFFNPRAGLSFAWGGGHKAYACAALGHREPGRSDIKEVIVSNNIGGAREEIRPERMTDIELGYQYSGRRFSAMANIYLMEYRDMLIETGKLSSVGYLVKDNASRSFRRGIELAVSWQAADWVRLGGNLTLSLNRLKEYTAYVDLYDNASDWGYLGQRVDVYRDTPILMSPSVIGMAQAVFTPFRGFARGSLRTTALSIDCKLVGRQFWDNTGCAERSLPAYYAADLSLTHEFLLRRSIIRHSGPELAEGEESVGKAPRLGLGLYVNNFTGHLHVSDAWVYRAVFADGSPDYVLEGLYPQAPVSFMFKLWLRF